VQATSPEDKGWSSAKLQLAKQTRNQDVKGKCQMNNQMNKKKAGVAFIALLTCALAGQALVSIRLTYATALFRRTLL